MSWFPKNHNSSHTLRAALIFLCSRIILDCAQEFAFISKLLIFCVVVPLLCTSALSYVARLTDLKSNYMRSEMMDDNDRDAHERS